MRKKITICLMIVIAIVLVTIGVVYAFRDSNDSIKLSKEDKIRVNKILKELKSYEIEGYTIELKEIKNDIFIFEQYDSNKHSICTYTYNYKLSTLETETHDVINTYSVEVSGK